MAGKYGSADVLVFDYTSDGRRQTVVLFPAGEPALPDFDLQPRDVSDVLLGPEGLLFDADRVAGTRAGEILDEFNRRYKLLAEPEAELPVRRLFPLATLAYFAEHPGWQVQCRGGNLAIWQDGRERSSEERPEFLARAAEMQRLLATPSTAGVVVAQGTVTSVRRAVFRWLIALGTLGLVGGILGSCAGMTVGMVLGAILGSPKQWLNFGQSWGIVVGTIGFVVLGALLAFLTRGQTSRPPTTPVEQPDNASRQE
jgi:hypothetical protein